MRGALRLDEAGRFAGLRDGDRAPVEHDGTQKHQHAENDEQQRKLRHWGVLTKEVEYDAIAPASLPDVSPDGSRSRAIAGNSAGSSSASSTAPSAQRTEARKCLLPAGRAAKSRRKRRQRASAVKNDLGF